MNNFENKLLVISTSPSDYGMLETLSKEVSNTNNVELLCLFEPYVKNTLNSDNLNINIQNLNLSLNLNFYENENFSNSTFLN